MGQHLTPSQTNHQNVSTGNAPLPEYNNMAIHITKNRWMGGLAGSTFTPLSLCKALLFFLALKKGEALVSFFSDNNKSNVASISSSHFSSTFPKMHVCFLRTEFQKVMLLTFLLYNT